MHPRNSAGEPALLFDLDWLEDIASEMDEHMVAEKDDPAPTYVEPSRLTYENDELVLVQPAVRRRY